jgi:hypothetical protein
MKYSYCPDCGRDTGHARRLGWGTFFMGVFTLGLSLFLIPLYPKPCTICGRNLASTRTVNLAGKRQCPHCGQWDVVAHGPKLRPWCPHCQKSV